MYFAEMKCGYVYMLKGPKDYIGQSVDPEKRWKDHQAQSKNPADKRGAIGEALRKHGLESFTMHILWEGPMEKLNEMEMHFIMHYNTLVPNGYNLKPGGGVRIPDICVAENDFLPPSERLQYIQQAKGGFAVKKPGHQNRYFVSTFENLQTKYAKAVDYLENIENYATAERRCVRKLRDGYRVRVEGHKDKQFVAASKSDEEKHQQALDYLHDLLDGKISPRAFPQVQGISKYRNGFRVQVPDHARKNFDSVKRTPKENYDLAVQYLTKLLAGEVEPETPKERAFPHVKGVSNHRAGFRVKKPGHAVKCFESVKNTKEENYNMAVKYANSIV